MKATLNVAAGGHKQTFAKVCLWSGTCRRTASTIRLAT